MRAAARAHRPEFAVDGALGDPALLSLSLSLSRSHFLSCRSVIILLGCACCAALSALSDGRRAGGDRPPSAGGTKGWAPCSSTEPAVCELPRARASLWRIEGIREGSDLFGAPDMYWRFGGAPDMYWRFGAPDIYWRFGAPDIYFVWSTGHAQAARSLFISGLDV